MANARKFLFGKVTNSHFKLLGLIAILVLALAVPATITLLNQSQDIRQLAAGSCSVHLAVPPRTFPTDIDPNPAAGKTKENYFKKWDITKDSYGQDLPRPEGKKNGKVDPTYCYLNNHAINIDEAKCGTSWYFAWAACSPTGSWRPAGVHGPLRGATNSEHSQACIGGRDTLKSNILVHFRNRLQYIKGGTQIGSDEARVKWNYLMAEVKSGMTTFGQMYSYDEDMDYAAQEFFGKSFNEVITQEKGTDCSMDSWEAVCRTNNADKTHINPVKCSGGATCSTDGSNKTYTCSNYTPKGQYPDLLTGNPNPAPSCTPSQTTPTEGGACDVNLAIPPRSFPTDIDPNPKVAKTKENYFKKWDIDQNKYTTDLEKPVGSKRDSKGKKVADTTYCYINNHGINIENAKCGTSWYYAWAQCSPGGSWRPAAPHGPLGKGSSHDAAAACTGEIDTLKSHFLTNFRNRVQYVKGNIFTTNYGPDNGRRAQWNYIMAEVRSGNTTFGQMYSYDDDMNYISQELFGKSFQELLNSEKSKGCATDAWNYVCRASAEDIYSGLNCTGSSSCLNHWQNGLSSAKPPKMTCSNYVAGSAGTGESCAPTSPTTKELKGRFDLARCDIAQKADVLRGWACHPGYKQPITVHIWDGKPEENGKQIATVKANLDRRNPIIAGFYDNLGTTYENKLISDECDGQENIGWATPVPIAIKNGVEHTLYAYAVDPINLNQKLLLKFYYTGQEESTQAYKVTCTNPSVVYPNSLPLSAPTATLGPIVTSTTPSQAYAGTCKIHLAFPPKNFATDIDPNASAYKTKENYFKKWDIDTKSYSSQDLERPVGSKRDSKGHKVVDQNTCYINTHPIGIDGAKCGTSWYYAWAQCSPGGSWRPIWPHTTTQQDGRPGGGSHDGAEACTGAWGVINQPFLVHFRNRANYINGFNFNERFGPAEGSRVKWNYLMAEVKSGNTTFGQMYSYEDDLNFASQLFFGKSYSALVAQEKSTSCTMDSWDYVCSGQPTKDDKNPIKASRGAVCLDHGRDNLSSGNPPAMVFSDYSPRGGVYPDSVGASTQSTGTNSIRALDLSDYNIFLNCYQKSPTCDDGQKSWSDINGDGTIDRVDLSLILVKF